MSEIIQFTKRTKPAPLPPPVIPAHAPVNRTPNEMLMFLGYDMVLNELKQHLIMFDVDGGFLATLGRGPSYFHGNHEQDYRDILRNHFHEFVKGCVEYIDTDEFRKSMVDDDHGRLFKMNYEKFITLDAQFNRITLNTPDGVKTICLTSIKGLWIITDLYLNHVSIRQRAFEVLMEKKGLTVGDLF